MNHIPAINKATRSLHWIVALAMLGLLAMGFYMSKFEVWGLYELHKSLALLACIAIALRLFWRYLRPWQALPSKASPMMQGLAKWTHRLLLMSTLAMPISGMLFSGISGHGFGVFGLRLLAANPDPMQPGEVLSHNKSLEVLAQNLHEYFGYAVVALLLLHIAGALKHHWVDKDATLLRMLGGTSKH
ncbi:cytochrome b [Roseateles oligotrophus]|uniref:Cytochrome b n=1 Tax=Roseateles oligotrophus TaxID=1769250 RepID=A0ABT2YCP3_9BURK|nr:cytochrome b [Roseateles oligotrophus]MCV2367807.1 cytochrome b [Roseateles oligotrophus]